MATPLEDIEAPLEDVEFLARSANRVRALNALTAAPIERHDLEEITEISRPTLSRILDDFEDRGWVDQDRRYYEATKLGSFTAREFIGLLNRFKALQALTEVSRWFPDGGFGFDLGCLAGAEVVRPHKNDALAPTARIVRRLDAADRVCILSYTVFPAAMEACWRATINRSHRLEAVFDSGALATVSGDATMVDRSKEMFETGRARIFHYEGDLPYVLFVFNDEVIDLCLGSKDGAPRAVIETNDETVVAWAKAIFDFYRGEARQLEPTAFAE